MAALTGKKPKNTYKDLLQVSNSNSGIDGTLRNVSDGEDTSSLLQLSSAATAVASGNFYVGDSANANMSQGVTINQGGNDDQIFAAKSSDVSTGLTSAKFGDIDVEVDDWLTIEKVAGDYGGARISAIAEDDASATVALQIAAYGGTPPTTDVGTSSGLFEFVSTEHDGANSLASAGATSNYFAFRVGSSPTTTLLGKGNGDWHITNTTLTALDEKEDAHLIRVAMMARNPTGLKLSAFDEEITYDLQDAIDCGILAGEDGGFIKIQGAFGALFGATWQGYVRDRMLAEMQGRMIETLDGMLPGFRQRLEARA